MNDDEYNVIREKAKEFKAIIYKTLSDRHCTDEKDVWLSVTLMMDLCRDAGDDYCKDHGIEYVDWSETV